MASRKKKVAAVKSDDTVTFKKSELVKKLKVFLEDEDACDGDWVNKVRVKFLGEQMKKVKATLQYETVVELELASSGLPSAEEVAKQIRADLDEGNFDVDIDNWSMFKVLKVE